MTYDFDEIIDRQHTNALNTDGFRGYIFHVGPEKVFPYKDEEFIRMWVADMEFATPPEICDAIRKRVDRRIFGYTAMFDHDFYRAFSGWCQSRYGWSFPEEELCFTAGIIPALYQLTEDLLAKDEKMLITVPSYGYFLHAAEYNGVEAVCSPLKEQGGFFSIDFDDLEKKAADPKVRMLLWCNPHNPTGRIWTQEELERVAEIVRKNDLWIISDEIHCDLVRSGLSHIPMGKIMPDYTKLVTCMSGSKTFNMAGLMFSDIIIRDKEERKRFKSRDKLQSNLNPLSLAAHQAAYISCGEWLSQLKTYLDDNFRLAESFFQSRYPETRFRIPEATYLAWVDLSRTLPDVPDLPAFFANEAGVLLEGGNSLFVGNAEGYVRLNLAMPRAVLQKGLTRMADAIEKHLNMKEEQK
ncbi:MAG: PatB family C-S lyase [Clostridia bacterium]|nr:PatB family C-S lyase [Clostridia bacterium]